MRQWISAHGTPQQVALRCRIVLASSQGLSDVAIAKQLSVNRKTVILWRQRFAQQRLDALWEIAPGRGRKPRFDLDKIAAIDVCTSLPTTPHLVVGRSACRVGVGPSLNRSWAQRSRPVVQAGRRAFPGDESVVD